MYEKISCELLRHMLCIAWAEGDWLRAQTFAQAIDRLTCERLQDMPAPDEQAQLP